MYTVGTKLKNYYPVWSPNGDLIAESLNIEDAKSIVNVMNKQIPEKPIQNNDKINDWYECGKCRHIVSKIMDKYCPHCGQKIEWE